jgi:hypothetical protein
MRLSYHKSDGFAINKAILEIFMDDMVERVAKALYAYEAGSTDGWDGPIMAGRREMWRKMASTAIAAMFEPAAQNHPVGTAIEDFSRPMEFKIWDGEKWLIAELTKEP